MVSATSIKATDFTSSFAFKCMGEIDILHCLTPGLTNRYSSTAFDVGPAIVEQCPSMRSMGVSGFKLLVNAVLAPFLMTSKLLPIRLPSLSKKGLLTLSLRWSQ